MSFGGGKCEGVLGLTEILWWVKFGGEVKQLSLKARDMVNLTLWLIDHSVYRLILEEKKEQCGSSLLLDFAFGDFWL